MNLSNCGHGLHRKLSIYRLLYQEISKDGWWIEYKPVSGKERCCVRGCVNPPAKQLKRPEGGVELERVCEKHAI